MLPENSPIVLESPLIVSERSLIVLERFPTESENAPKGSGNSLIEPGSSPAEPESSPKTSGNGEGKCFLWHIVPAMLDMPFSGNFNNILFLIKENVWDIKVFLEALVHLFDKVKEKVYVGKGSMKDIENNRLN
jgi:hypothetical protein